MSTPARHLPLWVALLLAGIYLLTTGGHTYASDEEQMFAVAEALATRGSFVIGVEPDGTPQYSIYAPGQPVLALPLVALGRAVAAWFPPEGYAYVTRAVLSWFNPLVTGATGGLLALSALRLGYGRRVALGLALVYGLATTAWPHSKTFFAEPLAAALAFASLAVALRPAGAGAAAVGRRVATLLLAGLLGGLACTIKIQAGLALPFLGLWVLWQEWRAPLTPGPGLPPVARRLLPPLAWGVGAVCGLGALLLYQWSQFGHPLRSGYGPVGGVTAILTNDLGDGLLWLLLSSGKGIIWYAPPLALLPVGVALLWRRDAGVALLCAAVSAATLLFYAKFIIWHGDGAWGPRYLNTALPFMALPLAALLGHGSRVARGALLVALALAVPVQLGGVMVNLNAYLGLQRDAKQRYFVPSQSPILGHLRLAGAQLATSYAVRLAPGTLALAEGFKIGRAHV